MTARWFPTCPLCFPQALPPEWAGQDMRPGFSPAHSLPVVMTRQPTDGMEYNTYFYDPLVSGVKSLGVNSVHTVVELRTWRERYTDHSSLDLLMRASSFLEGAREGGRAQEEHSSQVWLAKHLFIGGVACRVLPVLCLGARLQG